MTPSVSPWASTAETSLTPWRPVMDLFARMAVRAYHQAQADVKGVTSVLAARHIVELGRYAVTDSGSSISCRREPANGEPVGNAKVYWTVARSPLEFDTFDEDRQQLSGRWHRVFR